MAIDLAVDYAPYVDELFTQESKKDLLTNQDFTWTGAHSIKVYKITTSQMNDYKEIRGQELQELQTPGMVR